MYANEAGRELAKVLIQLIEAGIRINIITHSLGARVALSALNILGDFDGAYDEKVDNLIMWEAAVADNALTNVYTRDKNPVAMELFPFAHKVVKRIRALYSEEDGVLGADSYLDFDDGFSDLGRGAYPKKYSSLGNNTNALIDYYPIKLKGPNVIRELYGIVSNVKLECKVHQVYSGRRRCSEIPNIPFRNQIKADIRAALEEEAERTANSLDEPLIYLKPWSHYRRFKKGEAYFEHIIDVLMGALFDDWRVYETEVRPALGHQGERLTVSGVKKKGKEDVPLSNKEKIEFEDAFIKSLKDKKFFFFDRSKYFTTHSAMREFEFKIFDKNGFFADIYKESYKTQIMDRWIKENSKFGRY
ncbi:hypothetical protein [Exercitatus varius]|uniref:hypothetical protein n=1 Tax=Exercitatus varius TaxID=67857 RepID=UPI00294B3498|nr:hypothetical protein [Exercitatus varius]MDG2952454.1 hypothetical protein [Exercitatus varius]